MNHIQWETKMLLFDGLNEFLDTIQDDDLETRTVSYDGFTWSRNSDINEYYAQFVLKQTGMLIPVDEVWDGLFFSDKWYAAIEIVDEELFLEAMLRFV